jgi:hypothetical protein
MTDDLVFLLVVAAAAVCGAVVGRIIASEAQDRRAAAFAAAYCGAGAGLVSAPPAAFLLTLIDRSWTSQPWSSRLFDAAEATGPALLWGPAGGAAGGLVLGILVAILWRSGPLDVERLP